MKRKPKWWALALAVVLLAGSGFIAFKYHGFGWSRGHGAFGKFDVFDGRGHMSERFDKNWGDEAWETCWDEDSYGKGWGHRGGGRGMTYEMSQEDLQMTPDAYAKTIAEKMYGADAVVEPLEISERGVVAYQVIDNGKLVQVLIIDTEENAATLMLR